MRNQTLTLTQALPPLALLALAGGLLGLGYTSLFTHWLYLPADYADWVPATALALAILAVASSLVLVLRQQRHMRRHLQQAQQHQHSLQQALKHLEARAFAQAATVAQSLPGTLGSALAEMARSQAQVEQAAEMRNWHAEGMARFSDVLRQHSQLKDLSNALISEVCKYLKAQQGVLFLLKDIQGNELQVAGTFVSGQVAALLHDLNQGGLVEQVRRDSQPVHLKEVPPGYVAVKSGLGEAHPAELLLVPVLFEHKLLGVLELATFQPLRAEDLALAQELADKSAATFFNLMNAEQTTIMLEESQQLAFQLGEQTTAIRQASEEMRIKDRAITSSSSSIIIVDAQAPNMPIQYVNPAFEQT
ncbi:MAG: GAF domain-containing protein, partial [bacterium]